MALSGVFASVTGLLAQTGGEPAGGARPSGMGAGAYQLVFIVLIFVVFYFLLIRPQQKRQKEHRKMLDGLAKGDRVMTSGGMFGVIVGLDDNKVVLKIAENVKVEFAKSSIAHVVSKE
ncbi:MAG: preprotein translocase subunit YajC [bacterium]